MIFSRRKKGAAAELAALNFLKKHQLRLIQQNYYCRFGEIDLIMQDNETIVFIEVRQKQYKSYGNAATSITSKKQNKVRLSAKCYLHQFSLTHKCASRIDVISIDGDYQDEKNIHWFKNAF